MEFLKNANVATLIHRAIKAGAHRPSIEQLKTLAIAIGDGEAYRFLCNATVSDMAMVKTAAIVFNGEAPKSVSDGAGTLFGLVGEKETTIASEAQKRIYDIKAVLKDADETEAQKNMDERKKVEDKHPETSDHKTDKPVVTEPLKEKTDPEIKKVLERGEKDPVEKRDKTAGVAVTTPVTTPVTSVFEVTSSANTSSSVAATVTIAAELGKKDIEPVIKPVPEDKKHDPIGQLIDIANEPKKDIKPVPKPDLTSEAVLDSYVERIKKGEDIKKVLSEFMFLIEVTLEDQKTSKKPVDKKDEKKEEKPGAKKDEKEEKKPEAKKEEKPAEKKEEKAEKKEEKKEEKKDEKGAGKGGATAAKKNIMAANPGEQVQVFDPNKNEDVAVTVVGPSKRTDTNESFMVVKDEPGNLELFPAGTEYTPVTEQQKQTFSV